MNEQPRRGFWWDTSNFSGKADLFQVLGNKSRRLTMEGRFHSHPDWEWKPESFHLRSHAGKLHQQTPESIEKLVSEDMST